MIEDNIMIECFAPIKVVLNKIGPFQNDLPMQIDFTDKYGSPCNIFLLMSNNGRGKTTILDVMAGFFKMLGCYDNLDFFGQEELDTGKKESWAILDIYLKAQYKGSNIKMVLSLIIGQFKELPVFEGIDNCLEKIESDERLFWGFRYSLSGGWKRLDFPNKFLDDLIFTINEYKGNKPEGFEEADLTFPSAIYFSAYRDIIKSVDTTKRSISTPFDWGYRPLNCFVQEGAEWNRSLDNLLVWMKWLDDGSFEKAVKIINERVFEGKRKYLEDINKLRLEAEINNNGKRHRIDRLSSGEKSLVQMFLRIGAHLTLNTVLLIDELDVHLHPNMQHRILRLLKRLAVDNPGVTIIASTHSREILRAFGYDIEEDGIRKGGHLIEDDFKSENKDL